MAILPILTAPNPKLKLRSEKVTEVDDDLRRLMDDMLETMYQAPGIGLAAIQVGVRKQVIVIDVSREGEPRAPLFLVNPRLVWYTADTLPHEEGCLSVPGQYAEVERPVGIRVVHLDYRGTMVETAAEGLLSTCIQHEMDHLDGTLFIDHLSPVKRNMILRKLSKSKRQDQLERA